MEWRKANGRPEGFETMKARKPFVALGPEHPLEDEELVADFFRRFLTPYSSARHPQAITIE